MICARTSSTVAEGEVRSPVLGRRPRMSRWRLWPPQSSVSPSGFSSPTWWPVSRSEPVPRWCSASFCARSSLENELVRWSAGRNNPAGVVVVEAVGVRFFAPGTTPEMPLRAATCREAQDGHRPCEAAGHLSVPAASSCLGGSGRRVASDARLMHLMWCRLPVVSGGQWRPGRSSGGCAVFETCTIPRPAREADRGSLVEHEPDAAIFWQLVNNHLITKARDDGYESHSLAIDFDEPTNRDTPLTGNPAKDRPAAFYD